MKYIRKKALIASIIEFFFFSFFSCLLIRILFYVVILAFPVIAFMWTFWDFNVFTCIMGIQIMKRFKISFAVLNFLAVSLCIVFFIHSSELRNEMLYIVALTVAVVVGLLYVFTAIFSYNDKFLESWFKNSRVSLLAFWKRAAEILRLFCKYLV